VSPHFVILALGLPFSALAAAFFLYTANNSMALLIVEVSSDVPALLLAILSSVEVTDAALAPTRQSILKAGAFAKLTFVLPLLTFAALFHFCLSSSVSNSRTSLGTLLALAGFHF
jgi:hypothetical protein